MSDSFTNIPQAPRTPAQIPGRGEQAPSRGELIAAPNDLRSEAREAREAVRLRGEVTQVRERSDGGRDIHVKTPRGSVEVSVPEQPRHNNPPGEGQRVEIDVTVTGQGAETVVIRPAPAQNVQPAQVPQEPVQRNIPITPEALARARIAEIERNAPQVITPQNTGANGLPQPGSTVRIEPLSAQAAASILTPTLEVLPALAGPAPAAALLPASTLTVDVEDIPLQNLVLSRPAPATQRAQQILTGSTPEQGSAPPSAQVTQATLPVLQTSELLPASAREQPINPARIAAPFGPPSALEALQTQIAGTTPAYLNAKVEAVLPPAASLTETAEKTPAPIIENRRVGQITARVEGFTARGLPALQVTSSLFSTPQSFALQVTDAENIVTGSRLILSPQNTQNATLQNVVSAQSLQPGALLTPGVWPVMGEAFQVLAQNAPALAAAMAAVTPNPAAATAAATAAAQVTPAAMFFIAALRSGDMASWLGDKALEVLRRDGKGNLLSRLGAETSALSRMGGEPVAQDWRGLSIPLMWQNEMQKIALFYKHDEPGEDEKESKGKHTRFIFDLNLTRMGKVQLDGLLRGPKLDLILRTAEAFSGAMQAEMRRIYTNALEQAEMSGELSFTAQPEKWVMINVDKERQSVSA